jgi:predicted dehydrogenase
MTDQQFSRRYFFFGTLLAGAVPAAGFGSAPSLKSLGYKSPNEKLNIASIGAGGQAAVGINSLARIGQNIVALCDPDAARAAAIFRSYEKVPKYTDFRKMLEKEDRNIDAVLIATPDFMHGTQAMWAMERGKHVYVQKPMTRTVWEARQLKEAAVKYKVATQMGNQGYCQEGPRVCAEMIWSGVIGGVTEAHAWTNRPVWAQGIPEIPKGEPVPDTLDWDMWLGIARPRPFSTYYVPFQWRGWFDFGCGALGDMACHVLGAPNMALMLGAPTSVECIKQEGKNPYSYPKSSIIKFTFPARHNMPPLTLYWHDGVRDGLPAEFRPKDIPADEPLGDLPRAPARAQAGPPAAGRGPGGAGAQAPGRGAAGAQQAQGVAIAREQDPYSVALSQRTAPYNSPANSGVLYIGEKGYMTTGEYGGSPRLVPAEKAKDYQPPPPLLVRHPETYADWVRACKGGDPAASNFDVAAPFTEWIAMACIALRVEGKLEWDANRMQFTNNREANRYLKPEFRKGWSFT